MPPSAAPSPAIPYKSLFDARLTAPAPPPLALGLSVTAADALACLSIAAIGLLRRKRVNS